jgi:hypothetical protein
MTRGKSILLFVIVFLFGVVTGSGVGFVYGKGAYNAELEQSNAELQSQYTIVNQNYLLLMKEYNKLFGLKSVMVEAVAAMPEAPVIVDVSPTSGSSDVQEPTPAPESNPAPTAEPTQENSPEVPESTASPSGETQPPVANFEAVSINGTGPLEGPPPQPFEFTDLSTGTITSWEWDFGDGETSAEQNPEHTYLKCPGDQELCTVKLKVCGPAGCDTMIKEDYLWVSESCTGC